ncbi:hypothetical protein CANARDRAFT_69700 [[Candida] arabinofermentans NRRL YB-2248]|uniref:Telomere-associated protein Rif1 N-terminal domain-containing protein n=1 Tax=[Candida] arabinofermentans NRRL YB-2248 TaxID=983967 RepID=A0A1E4SXQ7_9ASCO|nr:hypothetical protein CANARDRAFT_69700 [[Candida] arabinofermentans NRRL YB-2248]
MSTIPIPPIAVSGRDKADRLDKKFADAKRNSKAARFSPKRRNDTEPFNVKTVLGKPELPSLEKPSRLDKLYSTINQKRAASFKQASTNSKKPLIKSKLSSRGAATRSTSKTSTRSNKRTPSPTEKAQTTEQRELEQTIESSAFSQSNQNNAQNLEMTKAFESNPFVGTSTQLDDFNPDLSIFEGPATAGTESGIFNAVPTAKRAGLKVINDLVIPNQFSRAKDTIVLAEGSTSDIQDSHEKEGSANVAHLSDETRPDNTSIQVEGSVSQSQSQSQGSHDSAKVKDTLIIISQSSSTNDNSQVQDLTIKSTTYEIVSSNSTDTSGPSNKTPEYVKPVSTISFQHRQEDKDQQQLLSSPISKKRTDGVDPLEPELNSSPLKPNAKFENNDDSQQQTRKQVIFSSDVESSPLASSPVRGAPEPKSILKPPYQLADAPEPRNVEHEYDDMSWPSGFVLQLESGSPHIPSTLERCAKVLANTEFLQRYEVYASIANIIRTNSKEYVNAYIKTESIGQLIIAIDYDLMKISRGSKVNDAFNARTATQAVKVLSYVLANHKVAQAEILLEKCASLLMKPNLSKGMASSYIQLFREQSNGVSTACVGIMIYALLNMKPFVSSTVMVEKLQTIRRFIIKYPGVMLKWYEIWMSLVLSCILNTEVPSYDRVIGGCILVLFEASKINTGTNRRKFHLLINQQFAKYTDSGLTMSTRSEPDNKLVSLALIDTMKFMVEREMYDQVMEVWAYLTVLMDIYCWDDGLETWELIDDWVSVFDICYDSVGDEPKIAAIRGWRAIIYCYHQSFPSRIDFPDAKAVNDMARINAKFDLISHPFKDSRSNSSPAVLTELDALYKRLYLSLARFTLKPPTSNDNLRYDKWIVSWILQPLISPAFHGDESSNQTTSVFENMCMMVNNKSRRLPPPSPNDILFKEDAHDFQIIPLHPAWLVIYYKEFFQAFILLFSYNVHGHNICLRLLNLFLSAFSVASKKTVPSIGSSEHMRHVIQSLMSSSLKKDDLIPSGSLIKLSLGVKEAFGLRGLTSTEDSSGNVLALIANYILDARVSDETLKMEDFRTFDSFAVSICGRRVGAYYSDLLRSNSPNLQNHVRKQIEQLKEPIFVTFDTDIWKEIFKSLGALSSIDGSVIKMLLNFGASAAKGLNTTMAHPYAIFSVLDLSLWSTRHIIKFLCEFIDVIMKQSTVYPFTVHLFNAAFEQALEMIQPVDFYSFTELWGKVVDFKSIRIMQKQALVKKAIQLNKVAVEEGILFEQQRQKMRAMYQELVGSVGEDASILKMAAESSFMDNIDVESVSSSKIIQETTQTSKEAENSSSAGKDSLLPDSQLENVSDSQPAHENDSHLHSVNDSQLLAETQVVSVPSSWIPSQLTGNSDGDFAVADTQILVSHISDSSPEVESTKEPKYHAREPVSPGFEDLSQIMSDNEVHDEEIGGDKSSTSKGLVSPLGSNKDTSQPLLSGADLNDHHESFVSDQVAEETAMDAQQHADTVILENSNEIDSDKSRATTLESPSSSSKSGLGIDESDFNNGTILNAEHELEAINQKRIEDKNSNQSLIQVSQPETSDICPASMVNEENTIEKPSPNIDGFVPSSEESQRIASSELHELESVDSGKDTSSMVQRSSSRKRSLVMRNIGRGVITRSSKKRKVEQEMTAVDGLDRLNSTKAQNSNVDEARLEGKSSETVPTEEIQSSKDVTIIQSVVPEQYSPENAEVTTSNGNNSQTNLSPRKGEEILNEDETKESDKAMRQTDVVSELESESEELLPTQIKDNAENQQVLAAHQFQHQYATGQFGEYPASVIRGQPFGYPLMMLPYMAYMPPHDVAALPAPNIESLDSTPSRGATSQVMHQYDRTQLPSPAFVHPHPEYQMVMPPANTTEYTDQAEQAVQKEGESDWHQLEHLIGKLNSNPTLHQSLSVERKKKLEEDVFNLLVLLKRGI